jgi:DNA polymerase I-like protein with 3'-5' exonuclease and polymerase domains
VELLQEDSQCLIQNLQQIPARHKELGPMIRSIFIPEENCKWGVFDYSQQEPRILVHYAKLQN